jgi:hypothetical protein
MNSASSLKVRETLFKESSNALVGAIAAMSRYSSRAIVLAEMLAFE